METAIRWASSSTTSDQRFLIVDVNGRTFKQCQVESYDGLDLHYQVLSTHRKVPPFRAFDWSCDEKLVAVGQWSGEATVLRLEDESQTLSLPIKHQRLCNAVAFSSGGLLATGLERVRNDFCLNVWDIDRNAQSSATPSSPRPSTGKKTMEPVRKLASSEGITSIKFFPQPETLVAGVKGTCLRIYDLRENNGNPSLQMQTGCVHNIAIDVLDDNYFASAAPPKDSTIQIWDRRAGFSSSASMIGTGLGQHSHHVPALEFSKAFDDPHSSSQASVWSLKFCKAQRGCLGALASTGDYKVFQTQKQYQSRTKHSSFESENSGSHAELIFTKRIFNMGHAPDNRKLGPRESSRIVSFDFSNLGGPQGRACAITLSADHRISIQEVEGSAPALSISSLGALATSKDVSGSSNGASITDDLEFSRNINLMLASEVGSIAQSLQHVRSKWSQLDSIQLLSTKHLSSREAHEKLFVAKEPKTLEDALTLSTIVRRRCTEGYLFSCKRNAEIVSDDAWLRDMWGWIGRAKGNAADGGMLADSADLSFLGISRIWNNELGFREDAKVHNKASNDASITNAVESLTESLQLPVFNGVDTMFPFHRQLCLHSCGLALTDQQLELTIKDLVNQGQGTRAALLALTHERSKLASNALRNGKSTPAHRELALALAGYDKGNAGDMWDETVREIARELDDPYARAILALVSNGDWHNVLDVSSVPLKDRVLVALMHLDDQVLTEYIAATQENCIREGDIEGIVLTGLTEDSVCLFQNYMLKFSDLQTPVLALSFTSPRYFSNPLVDLWREAYRSQLNTYRLFIQRVQFDVKATKLSIPHYDKGRKPLLAPAPRQVSLRCSTCDQALDRNPRNMPTTSSDPTAFGSSQRTSIFGDVKSGTVCPKCGRHMPRCVICMMWLGMPDAHGKGASAAANSARNPVAKAMRSPDPKANRAKRQGDNVKQAGQQAAQDVMKDFVTVCRACWHMSHGSHAAEWFRGHDVCAVPGCDCRCALLDGGSGPT